GGAWRAHDGGGPLGARLDLPRHRGGLRADHRRPPGRHPPRAARRAAAGQPPRSPLLRMSPAAAIQSEIFRFYVGLVAAVLVTTGLALAVLRAVLGSPVSHAWAAYRGWLIMAPPVLACVCLGREATILFLTAVAALGFRELALASELASDRTMTAVGAGGIAAVGIACLLPDPVSGRPGWYGLFTALPVSVVAAAVLVPVVRNRPRGAARVVSLRGAGLS